MNRNKTYFATKHDKTDFTTKKNRINFTYMWRHSPHQTHARGGEISWALCITGEISNHFPRKVIFATMGWGQGGILNVWESGNYIP